MPDSLPVILVIGLLAAIGAVAVTKLRRK